MSADAVVAIAGNSLLILGAVILASAGVGVLRLPDLYTRTSAVGTAAGLGISVIILGVLVLDFSALNLLKAALAIVAQLLTSAVGSFALARAGYLTGSAPVETTSPDELAIDTFQDGGDRHSTGSGGPEAPQLGEI